MNEERLQAYMQLIDALLKCPSGQEQDILNANRDSVDPGLAQTMVNVAEDLAQSGNQDAANFLRNAANRLHETRGLSMNVTKASSSRVTQLISPEEYRHFLLELLQTTLDSGGDQQVVYPLLQANLHKLDDACAHNLRNWATARLQEEDPERAKAISVALSFLGSLMLEFSLGNRASNLEIALTSSEVAATVFQRESFPEIWARNELNLGNIYRNRVRGDRADNLEKAITAYRSALQVYTQERFPEEWAMTQNDLANAYCDRIKDNRAKNLEKAINSYEAALQVLIDDTSPERAALTQYNLAVTYYDRIEGDRLKNLESAVKAYEAAFRVYTQEAFPEMWAITRNNLIVAYEELLRNGQSQYFDRLTELTGAGEIFRFLEEVLRTISANRRNPQVVYPLLQSNLDKLNDNLAKMMHDYTVDLLSRMKPDQAQGGALDLIIFSELLSRFPFGSRASNLEIAIAGNQAAMTVYTREEFPQQWAAAQVVVGDLCRERIRGQRIENLMSALAIYHEALQVFTDQAFPQKWAKLQESMGMAYKDLGLSYKNDRHGDDQKNQQLASDNLERAIEAYQYALQVLTQNEFPPFWAAIQDNLANVYQQRIKGDQAENLELAIAARQSALKVYTKEDFPQDWAMVQMNLGTDYRLASQIGVNQSENLEGAIKAYQSALEVWTRDSFPYHWATIQTNLGNAYRYRSDGELKENLKSALAAYEGGLTIFKTNEEFPERYMQLQTSLCDTFLLLLLEEISNDPKEGQELYPSLQEHLDKLDDNVLIQVWQDKWVNHLPQEFAEGISRISNIFLNLTTTVGRKFLNTEIAIIGYVAILGVDFGVDPPDALATTKRNLGSAYINRIRGDRAENLELGVRYLEEALQSYDINIDPEMWALIQSDLGRAHFLRIKGKRATNLERAIEYFDKALLIFTYEAFPEHWRRVKNDVGMVYSERIQGEKSDNIEKAIKAYQEILSKLTATESPTVLTPIYNNLGIAYGQRILGDPNENLEIALRYFEKIKKIYTFETNPEKWASLQKNLGNIYCSQGEIEKAIESFRLALQIFTPTTFPVDCLSVGRELGNISFEAGRWAEAIEGYEVAIEAVEQSRSWSVTEERRQEILEKAIGVYGRIVQALINNGKQYKVIEYIERSKARNLVELLAARNLHPKGDFPPEVLHELDRLRREIAAGERGIDNNAALKIMRQQLDNLITEQIKPIDPTFSLTQRVESMQFQEIMELLPDKKTGLIEWYVTHDYLYTFLITPERSVPIVLSLPSENYNALMNWASTYLYSYSEQIDKWRNELPGQLKKLAEILQFDQLISQIPSTCERLILIPHRFLHVLPLHALPLNDGSCLLDKYQNGISYAPSCQLLQLVQNQQRPNIQNFFAIQNPTKDLAYTDLEVEIIRSFFSKENAQVFVQQTATKDALNNYQNLPFIHCGHFSCHGYFNTASPLKSALLLADCYIPTPENPDPNYHLPLNDGRTIDLTKCLTLGNIFSLNLNQCSLVTLSACETGLTDFSSSSDEYIGLPSGFLFAGSSSVVSSLWSVNDLSTAFLLVKFYENLKKHPGLKTGDVAVALNQAQLWLRDVTKEKLLKWIGNLPLNDSAKLVIQADVCKLADDYFKNPFHWAAFCAIGQ